MKKIFIVTIEHETEEISTTNVTDIIKGIGEDLSEILDMDNDYDDDKWVSKHSWNISVKEKNNAK